MKKKILQGSGLFLFVLLVAIQSSANDEDQVTLGFYTQGDVLNFWGNTIDETHRGVNFQNGVNCPRHRYFMTVRENDWIYSITYDAAAEKLLIANLKYVKSDNYNILIGSDNVGYSFWSEHPAWLIEFMDFALITNAFNPSFRVQLKSQFFRDPFTLLFSLAGPDTKNTIYGAQVKGHLPLAEVGRLTYVPIHTETKILHFGLSAMFQDSDSLHRFKFASFPEVQEAPNVNLVNTGLIPNCQNFIGYELEAITMLNSFTFTTEYYYVGVNRNQGLDNLKFDGYFFTVDYFITGEHYIYDFKLGAYNNISKIKSCNGAWQIAARYSTINLESDGIHGGREYNTTLGLNWYVNDYLTFKINYVHVDTFPSQNGLNRHLNILALRCQLYAKKNDLIQIPETSLLNS